MISEGIEGTEVTETLTNGGTELTEDETERQGWLCESGFARAALRAAE